MGPVRRIFLETAGIVRDLVASSEVAVAWERPSALPKMEVSSLCGHLARVVARPTEYLEDPEPEEDPVGAAEYYVRVIPSSDIDHPVNVGVRERSVADAEGGHPATVAKMDDALAKAELALETEPDIRKVTVFQGAVMRLDDYLTTRIIELVVHGDDLSASVGLPSIEPPRAALHLAIEQMIDIARLRHGDVAVMRALSRRERDDIEALRVF